jgi:hypothetical protein
VLPTISSGAFMSIAQARRVASQKNTTFIDSFTLNSSAMPRMPFDEKKG